MLSKRNTVVKIGSLFLCGALITGCGASSEINELNNLTALNTETESSTVKTLSASAEEAAVYAQVSDRTLLDLTTLEEVSATDEAAVVNYMDSVDAQLCGTMATKDGVIGEEYVNYLLMEFEKTPYYWQRTQMNIRGMDASSRSIIVDVKYKTIGFEKDVKHASYISRGEPNYDTKVEVRFNRWLEILGSKYGYGAGDWESDLKQFVETYGEPEDIIDEQSYDTLATYTYKTGNQKTYTGLVDTECEQSAAEMTIRYILVPQYSLGINLGYNCEHMYVLDYKLISDPTANKEIYNAEGSASIADSVYNLLYSLYQAEDENNYDGLYSLIADFDKLDKYYKDYFDTTYRKHNNYTITLFSVQGTKLECGVNASVKVRAKGSNMTFPLYNQRWYYEMELVDGKLKITNAVLLSEELQGEPIINTEDAETSGFTATITLTNQDKRDLESLIANFSAVQLRGDTTSDAFSDVVDTSISTSQMEGLKESFNMITGVRKVVWITSYLQGTSNYASIKVKELYQAEDNSITEDTATYEFINRAGKWYIYDYTINSHAKLDSTDLATKNSLCLVEPGEVKNLNSQVVSTSEDDTVTPAVIDVSTIGKVTDYAEYTPVLKSGVASTGLAIESADSLSDTKFEEWVSKLVEDNGMKREVNVSDFMNNYYGAPSDVQGVFKSIIANYENYYNNYYNESQYTNFKNGLESDFEELMLDYQDKLDALKTASTETEEPVEGEEPIEGEESEETTSTEEPVEEENLPTSEDLTNYRQMFGYLKGMTP